MPSRRTCSLLLGLVTFAACGGSAREIEQLQKEQRDLLAKLEAVERVCQEARIAQVVERTMGPLPAVQQPPRTDPNKIYDIPVGDSPVRGPGSAKVTITEFGDFQCPLCAQSVGVVDEVLKAYPNDVRLVYKQLPLPPRVHPDAMAAAKAAVAAGRQGKFWEMHDMLFQHNRELGFDKLKEYAGKIGLDVARWEKDFNSPGVEQQVYREKGEGYAADSEGTPTFFVNGRKLRKRTFAAFKDLIEQSLKENG